MVILIRSKLRKGLKRIKQIGVFKVMLIFFLGRFIAAGYPENQVYKYPKTGSGSGSFRPGNSPKMLRENGINEVKLTGVNAFLSGRYNTVTKSLSTRSESRVRAAVSAAARMANL